LAIGIRIECFEIQHGVRPTIGFDVPFGVRDPEL
jgi:hypothetical protein